jgi:hypothetical protein
LERGSSFQSARNVQISTRFRPAAARGEPPASRRPPDPRAPGGGREAGVIFNHLVKYRRRGGGREVGLIFNHLVKYRRRGGGREAGLIFNHLVIYRRRGGGREAGVIFNHLVKYRWTVSDGAFYIQPYGKQTG